MSLQIKHPTNESKLLFLKLNGPTIWLAYLLLYFALWIINPPHRSELVASLIAIGLFLGIYYDAYYKKGTKAWYAIAAITAISITMATYTSAANIFFIYAVMIATQSQQGTTRLVWLVSMFIAVMLPAFSDSVSWYYFAGCIIYGPLVAVATATNCKLQDQAQTLLENRTEMRDLAITAERERIARDMHDTLGHLLSIMTAKADLALRLTDKDLEEARQEIKDIHLTGRQALKDVRRVIAGMENTTIANELGHARYLLETANIHVTLVNQTIELPASHQHALGMIIREATTNIVRHSNATRCEILLHQQRNQLKLTILDNGEGGVFAPKTGLLSMRERTERLSGEFTINYTKQEGTRLTVQLPLDADLTP